ncbi:MAG: hypothetical protein HRT71_18630 [Flavobacteriales bacterium]|nr:hypothetical protein [Flavobacteriales bacterium]
MKKSFLVLIFIAAIMASCGETKDKVVEVIQDNVEFNKVLEEYYEEGLKIYPMSATYAGDTGYNDLLPNPLSDEFAKTEKAFYEGINKQILGFLMMFYQRMTS